MQLNLFRNPADHARYEALQPKFMQVANLIPWESFRSILLDALQYKPAGQGRKPHDPVMMFKILVLQHFYDLSDDSMEFQLRDRESFRRFIGIHKNATIPDSKTIWLFRDKLAQAQAMQPLFDKVNQHIESQGYIAQGGQMIDATIIEARKPTERRTPEEINKLPDNQRQQTDPDASFTKKGEKSYFGYKAHANVDAEHKIARKLQITTAKDGDITVMSKVMDDRNTKKTLWADSAYKSAEMDQALEEKAITNRINRRAYRNRPLNGHDERFNRTSSRTRSRIEHVFGQVKLWGRKVQVRSIGLGRATLGIGLKFMVYNMNRLRFLEERAALEMAC